MKHPHTSLITQPSPYAGSLVEALKPYSELRTILPRRQLHMVVSQNNYCFLIIDGQVSVHRKADDRMLACVSSPSLFGIRALVDPHIDFYLKALTPVLVGKMSLAIAELKINELNLWESLAKHMMVSQTKLLIHHQQITAATALIIVCEQLQELMSEQSHLRNHITAELYIRNKTSLSRSRVMHILAKLKKGSHIETEKGILKKINHLPQMD